MDKRQKKHFIGLRELYIGESKSGKTHLLMQNLMRMFFDKSGHLDPFWKKNLKIILVMPTLETNSAFEGNKFPELRKIFMDKKMTRWYKEWNQYVSQIILNAMEKFNKKKQLLVILDDVGANGGIKNGASAIGIKEIGTIAPHRTTILLGLFQRMTQTPLDLRQNFDRVHLFKTENRNELNHFQKTFFGRINSFKDFTRVFIGQFDKPFDYFTIERGKGGVRKFFKNGKRVSLNELE